jgi:hypothetical protein
MVARIRHDPGLTVVFRRGGREQESETASTGERALKLTIVMLARLDDLRDGDRLTVAEAK